jgi:chemotaxis protein MotA
MEPIIGLVAGFGLVVYGILMGSSLTAFIDIPSVFITLGGSTSAMLVNFSFAQFASAFKALSLLLKNKPVNTANVLNQIVEFAKKARREGLLALEEEAQRSDDEFLKKGIQLIVDGTDPELVRNILEIELSFMEERHKSNKAFFDAWGTLAPAFGMIGTVIGLVQMLGNLQDVSKIGPNMAVALITTFYGAVWANLVCVPIAGKLAIKSGEEQFVKQIMIEGILSIQAGENPRIVEEKLLAFLSASERNKLIQVQTGAGGEGGKIGA